MGLARAAAGVHVTVARLWNPVGPGMPRHLALADFAAQIAAMPTEGGILRVGNLEVERDFLDVREVARLIVGLAMHPDAAGLAVNVCSGRAYRLRDLVENMACVAGRVIRVVVDQKRLRFGELSVLRGDTARLAKLGLHPAPPDFDVLLPELIAEAQADGTSPRSSSS